MTGKKITCALRSGSGAQPATATTALYAIGPYLQKNLVRDFVGKDLWPSIM